jgi:spore maturation protein CgeB
MGCGVVLLTNWSQGYDKLGFEHDETCFIYDSYQNLKDVMAYIEDDFVNAHAVAQRGLDLVRTCHTYDVRMKELVDIVSSL